MMAPMPPRTGSAFRRSLFVPFASATLLLALASGCARKATPPPTPPPSAPTQSPATPDEELPPPQSEPPPPKPGPCATGGRLWDGKPEDCSYEHGGCCYASPATACAAAGCTGSECQVLESYPAQIMCVMPPGPCEIRHEGRCFSTKETACEAAGCPLERCTLQKSYPAQISCGPR